MLDTKGHRPPEAMMGPEAMARELARAESIEVPAQDAHDLIEATEDAIEELEIKFARNDQALEQLTMLSDRVLFYLEKDGEPTPFAEALLTDSDDRTINQELAVVQISQIITSEVNPILFKLREAIKSKDTRSQAGGDAEEEHSLDDVESLDPIDTSPELEHDPLALGDELVPALKSGKVENQVTTTLFGALEGLSDTEKHVAKELIILNPLALDQDNVDYWSTQMSAHKEVTGEKVENYAELIAGRSVRAVYELDTLAERLGTKQYEADSITALAQFINNKIDLLEGDFENAAKELSFFDHDRLGMTGDEVIDLLNAAEVLKKEDPQLYARLLGIAPGRKKAESQRSDLFGNVFQIALDASQKDPKRQNKYKNKAGQEIVDKYIDGLTKIESHQLPLNYLNEQQLNILQQRLTLEMTKEDGKPNEFLVINLMSKINLAKRSDEARKFLEGLNEAVDEEGKERMKFKQDMEWIQEFRKDISLQAKEKMAVNTSLAKAFVARKEYSKAGGHIRKAVGFHMRDIDAMVLQNSFLIFMLTNILPQIPDKDLLANPDAIIKDLSGAMYTSDFTPYIVERYLEAGDPMEAFAYFSNLELTSGSQRLRELFADVPEKMAEELEAIGLHEEARSLLNDPNLFDVRVVEVEGRTDKKEVVQEYLNEGLISEAERVIASIDDKNEKEAAKDLIFNKFIEVGDFERAQRYTSRFHSYERSFGRFTELLLAKKEAGENIDVEVRQYLESIKFDEEKYKKGRASWFGGRDTEQVKGEKIQYGKFESRIKKLYFKDKMGEDVDTQMRNLLAGIEHAKVGRDMTVDMYLDLLPLADDESSPLTLSEINYELGAKLYEFSSSGKSISPESKQKIIKSYCDNGGYVEALSFAHRFDIGFKTVARAAMRWEIQPMHSLRSNGQNSRTQHQCIEN